MARQSILVATDNSKAIEFFTTYFSDTQSTPTVIRAKSDLSAFFSARPDFVFFQGDWFDLRTKNKLVEYKSRYPKAKYFVLGHPIQAGFTWDGILEFPVEGRSFRKVVLNRADLPNPIKLVAVDDEVEILEIVQDYFEGRTDPPVQMRIAHNGLEGFKLIEKDPPHCLILDIKMPVKTGVELYRDLVRSGRKIPTIIFIDSTSADDILEIRKWGAPVFVEKGGPSSSMSDMFALVKKLIIFS
ncbi:MAG: response regulator [Candidatus Omnitrophica bacterium]|nr:response regulator [Candidatus Omnitrophota bacterium]